MRPELLLSDWAIIVGYVVFAVVLGSCFTKKASTGLHSFFVGDRKLPWWVAGTSIVATTFAADTPLAVTGLVASGGISANWLWWNYAIAYVCSAFFFARLWRRSGVITDAEITELRYGGRPAAVLRGVKAIYSGLFLNCMTMAWVIAAMVKISQAFFDVPAASVITVCVIISVTYTTLGGFRSVVITDFVQFLLGMTGAIALAVIVANHYGGLGEVEGAGLLGELSRQGAEAGRPVADTLGFVPTGDHKGMPLVYFVVLLFAGWWRYAEGNGYLVQRLASCKDEGHAQGANLWFAIANNALRPWPWIVVGLAALLVYPVLSGPQDVPAALRAGGVEVQPAVLDVVLGGDLEVRGVPEGSIVTVLGQSAALERDGKRLVASFGPFSDSARTTLSIQPPGEATVRRVQGLTVQLTDREMGYPLLMGRFLPPGLLGLVVASLLAAFMSTIDTHTNWGASYLVQDVYRRFIRPDAPPRHYVTVSRVCILLMAILAGIVALFIESIAEVWVFIITIGAGLGSVSAVRWYWHRVTPHAELAAIGVTTALAIGLPYLDVPAWQRIVIIGAVSLATWIPVSLFGPANPPDTLRRFAEVVRPPGPGWPKRANDQPLWPTFARFFAGLFVVFGAQLGIGEIVVGSTALGVALTASASVVLVGIVRSG